MNSSISNIELVFYIKKPVNFKGWTGFVMILINLLCLNENIMGVNLHENKIKIFFRIITLSVIIALSGEIFF
jgi:hypothetical protein